MQDEVNAKIKQFFSSYRLRQYPKGQILIHAGDTPDYVHYIIEGKVRQYDISYRGDAVVVNVFKPGAFFPMLPVLTDLPNKYFFQAETDMSVHIAPPVEVDEFLKSNPDILYDLLKRVYIGLDGVLGRMFQLMSGSARTRVLYELIIECRRFGEKRDDGSYFIALHEDELAGRAGLSRETVSREIHHIGKDGLITASHKGIVITDLESAEKRLAAEL